MDTTKRISHSCSFILIQLLIPNGVGENKEIDKSNKKVVKLISRKIRLRGWVGTYVQKGYFWKGITDTYTSCDQRSQNNESDLLWEITHD